MATLAALGALTALVVAMVTVRAVHTQEGPEPFLAIVPAPIRDDHGGEQIEAHDVHEVETVLLEIGEPLRFVPLEFVQHAGQQRRPPVSAE